MNDYFSANFSDAISYHAAVKRCEESANFVSMLSTMLPFAWDEFIYDHLKKSNFQYVPQ